MPNYMLLLYADYDAVAAEGDRSAEMGTWMAVLKDWWEDGSLVSNGRLHPVSSATTLRIHGDDEPELTDGPFAETKEMLGGYILLECPDLDDALRKAARLPIARYGCVEVRPVMEDPFEGRNPDGVATSGDTAAA